jgi:hypothetical protein
MSDSFVDASEIFERVKRKAQVERADPFTMDPEKGLSVKVVTDLEKRSARKSCGSLRHSRLSVALEILKARAGRGCCAGKMAIIENMSMQSQTATCTGTCQRFALRLPPVV